MTGDRRQETGDLIYSIFIYLFSKQHKTKIMFGDLMGGMQEQQEAMRKKLEGITIEAEAGGGAVKVTVTATRKIVNISVDPSILDPEDAEQLEDLLVVAINKGLEKAALKEAAAAQDMLKDMLPPGMGDLDGLF